MVQMAKWKPVAVLRVLDRDGRPIGEVVQPKLEPLIGRGAGTVLLIRGACESLLTSQHSLLRL
jgi:hypothetical protein